MQQQRKESSYCTYASISVSSCRRLTTRRHDGNNPLLTHAQQALAAPPAPECTHMHALPALLLGATACTSYQLPSPALVSVLHPLKAVLLIQMTPARDIC